MHSGCLPDKCRKDAFGLEALRAPTLPHYNYDLEQEVIHVCWALLRGTPREPR
jgi:hypothetical protein